MTNPPLRKKWNECTPRKCPIPAIAGVMGFCGEKLLINLSTHQSRILCLCVYNFFFFCFTRNVSTDNYGTELRDVIKLYDHFVPSETDGIQISI